MKKLTLLLLALALFGAACGGSDGDSALVTALAEDITADDDALTENDDEALCFARGVVDGVGEDRLAELGVTADNVGTIEEIDFTDAEGEKLVDSMFDCIDVSAMMAASFAEDFGEEAGTCIADILDEDTLRSFFAGAFSGEEAEPSEEAGLAFFEAMSTCGLDS